MDHMRAMVGTTHMDHMRAMVGTTHMDYMRAMVVKWTMKSNGHNCATEKNMYD